MRRVFVDTAAWIAILNGSDRYHEEAEAILDELERQNAGLVTTEFVLIEVADALSAPAIRTATVASLNSLRESQIQISPASSELLGKGWSLYSRRPDKGWGLTDCTSFVVMQEQGITEAFTSDQHFTQAGFQRLL